MQKIKQFKNLEDVLEIGVHVIEVKPKEEWSDTEQKYLRGTHQTGEVKNGKNKGKVYWLYSTNVPYPAIDEKGNQLRNNDGSPKQRYCGVIAFSPKDKEIFDQGQVKVEVKEISWYLSVEKPGKKYYSLEEIEAEGSTPLIVGDSPYKAVKIVANIKPMSYVPRMTPANTQTEEPIIDIDEELTDEIDTKDIPF